MIKLNISGFVIAIIISAIILIALFVAVSSSYVPPQQAPVLFISLEPDSSIEGRGARSALSLGLVSGNNTNVQIVDLGNSPESFTQDQIVNFINPSIGKKILIVVSSTESTIDLINKLSLGGIDSDNYNIISLTGARDQLEQSNVQAYGITNNERIDSILSLASQKGLNNVNIFVPIGTTDTINLVFAITSRICNVTEYQPDTSPVPPVPPYSLGGTGNIISNANIVYYDPLNPLATISATMGLINDNTLIYVNASTSVLQNIISNISYSNVTVVSNNPSFETTYSNYFLLQAAHDQNSVAIYESLQANQYLGQLLSSQLIEGAYLAGVNENLLVNSIQTTISTGITLTKVPSGAISYSYTPISSGISIPIFVTATQNQAGTTTSTKSPILQTSSCSTLRSFDPLSSNLSPVDYSIYQGTLGSIGSVENPILPLPTEFVQTSSLNNLVSMVTTNSYGNTVVITTTEKTTTIGQVISSIVNVIASVGVQNPLVVLNNDPTANPSITLETYMQQQGITNNQLSVTITSHLVPIVTSPSNMITVNVNGIEIGVFEKSEKVVSLCTILTSVDTTFKYDNSVFCPPSATEDNMTLGKFLGNLTVLNLTTS